MNESAGTRDVNVVSKVLVVGGLGALIGGIVRIVTAPAEVAMSAPGWFETAKAHGDAKFMGSALIMLGVFCLLLGLGMSARGRRAALAMRKQTLQAMSEGVAAGLGTDPKARLDRLEALRRDGTLTDAEYQRKRAEIVNQL